jgi:hypothetical protein
MDEAKNMARRIAEPDYSLKDFTSDLQVVVRHTFLEVPGTPEVTPKRRATSAPPPPDSCDREADTLCALTYKPRPVDQPLGQAKNGRTIGTDPSVAGIEEEEASPSESTATPDMDGASAAASEDATGLSQTQDVAPHFSRGDFLQVALSTSSNEWQMHAGVAQPQVTACSVPRDAHGMPTSIGSIGHAQGMCKPCVFAHHASKVCLNGVACPFCHFEHAPKQKRRIVRQR